MIKNSALPRARKRKFKIPISFSSLTSASLSLLIHRYLLFLSCIYDLLFIFTFVRIYTASAHRSVYVPSLNKKPGRSLLAAIENFVQHAISKLDSLCPFSISLDPLCSCCFIVMRIKLSR